MGLVLVLEKRFAIILNKNKQLKDILLLPLMAFKNISKYFHLTVDDLGDSDCVPRSPPRSASVEVAQVHADPAVRLHL